MSQPSTTTDRGPADAPAEPEATATGTPTAVTERQARAVAEEARETRWSRPSFAKELYLGRLRLDLVHPRPWPSGAEVARGEEFCDRLRAYCETLDGAAIERESRIPDGYLQGLAELGAFGMKIPEEYGGLGLPMLYYGRALMLVGSVHPSLGALLSAHQSIGVPEPVKLFGSEEQKREFLPRCAAGAISAFLLTEPDVGSDPARLAMSATPTEDGGYLLEGTKLWTTNGVIADLLVVMARVPESADHHGGVTAFVIDADSPGITVENRNAFMGLRGIENGVTRFDRVWVSADRVLAGEGQGLRIALTTLNTGRLSIPAVCAGGAKWALKVAREWSAERVQWGRPVGKHDAVAGKLARMATTAYALESVLELTACLADAGETDIRLEAALGKLYCSEQAWQVADELVQIRGGRGYETAASLAARGEQPVPVEQLFRDLRINRIFEGSTEIMHLFIAREAVDTHLRAAGDLADAQADLGRKARAAVRASGFYAGWLPSLVVGRGQLPTAYADFGPLAGHLRYVDRASKRLARQTFYGMARWQAGLQFRQRFLARIVDIGAELFTMAAACVRASALRTDGSPDAASATALARAFCAQARLRVESGFDTLWRNSDEQDYTLARGVLDGEHTWLEAGVLHAYAGGPLIAEPATGPSDRENLHRRVGRPSDTTVPSPGR